MSLRAAQLDITTTAQSLRVLLGIPETDRHAWGIKMQSPAANTDDILWGSKNQQPMILASAGVTEEAFHLSNLESLYLRSASGTQTLNVAVWH